MTTTPQVPGCGFCNHPGFNTYEGDTCPECGRGTTPQPEKLIAGSTVISNPGATLRVEQLHLTEAGKKAITVQVQAADEEALRERARSLAEHWHEGVPTANVFAWCCQAAGALLSLSTLPEPAAAPAAGEPQTLDSVQRLKATIEECEGLAITDEHAKALLQYVLGNQALPSLGLHATEGRAETCDVPEGAPRARSRLLTQAIRDVWAERLRQVNEEGWTHEHDDEHATGGMAYAAACYAVAGRPGSAPVDQLWAWTGWHCKWFKPKDARSNLVRAGALVIAEIERLDRLGAATKPVSQEPTGSGS